MKIIFSLLLIMFLTVTLNAQQKLISRYFSLDSVEVSYEEFQKLREVDRYKYVQAYFKNQNYTMFVKLVKRKVIGQLQPLQTNQIVQYFGRLDPSINTNTSLLIKHFQGDDPCSSSGTRTGKERDAYFLNFTKQITKRFDVQIIQVKTKNSSIDNRTEFPDKWLTDKYSVLNTFFPYHYPCGSFMILKPSGEYYIYYGEYGLDNALDGLKKIKVEKAK